MKFVAKSDEIVVFNNGSKKVLSEKEVIELLSEHMYKDLFKRVRGNRQKICEMLNSINQNPKKASEELKKHFVGCKGIESTIEKIQMRISGITF